LTLFDPSPKSSVRDLYGREKELSDLVRHLDQKKWVVLLGPRRIGKTSLAMCSLSKTKVKKAVVVDAREESDFAKALLTSLSPGSRVSHLNLTTTVGVTTASLDIQRDFKASIGKLIAAAGKIVILIDEAQWLRNPRKVSSLLAHIYDYHYDKVTIIITGSAVGVMKSIIEPTSKSPLYGRALTSMELGRWHQSESLGFLETGCKQTGLKYDTTELSTVVERLDGIPGWLTLFGYNYSNDTKGIHNALKKTLGEASKIVNDELENVSALAVGWERQKTILKEIGTGQKSFSEIGKDLGINNTALSHNLEMLRRLGYVSKQESGEYVIIDPMVAKTIAESK
jgi:uncharacterized protein